MQNILNGLQVLFLFIILFIFFFMIWFSQPNYVNISKKKKRIDAKGIKQYVVKRESLKIILCIIAAILSYYIHHKECFVICLIISICIFFKPALRILTICLNSEWYKFVPTYCLSTAYYEDGGSGPEEYSTSFLKIRTTEGNFIFKGLSRSFELQFDITHKKIVIVSFKFEKYPYALMVVPDTVTHDFKFK